MWQSQRPIRQQRAVWPGRLRRRGRPVEAFAGQIHLTSASGCRLCGIVRPVGFYGGRTAPWNPRSGWSFRAAIGRRSSGKPPPSFAGPSWSEMQENSDPRTGQRRTKLQRGHIAGQEQMGQQRHGHALVQRPVLAPARVHQDGQADGENHQPQPEPAIGNWMPAKNSSRRSNRKCSCRRKAAAAVASP